MDQNKIKIITHQNNIKAGITRISAPLPTHFFRFIVHRLFSFTPRSMEALRSIMFTTGTLARATLRAVMLTIFVLFSTSFFTTSPAQARPDTVVDIFYDDLEDDGEWLRHRHYGLVWRPYDISTGWQPYVEGHWIWTAGGWYWESDEPWANITYHYGRWVYTDNLGWVWCPGNEWAPAWVTWREYDSYVGWYPTPPGRAYFDDYGYERNYRTLDKILAAQYFAKRWVFVPRRHFSSRGWYRHRVHRNRHRNILANSVRRNVLGFHGNRITRPRHARHQLRNRARARFNNRNRSRERTRFEQRQQRDRTRLQRRNGSGDLRANRLRGDIGERRQRRNGEPRQIRERSQIQSERIRQRLQRQNNQRDVRRRDQPRSQRDARRNQPSPSITSRRRQRAGQPQFRNRMQNRARNTPRAAMRPRPQRALRPSAPRVNRQQAPRPQRQIQRPPPARTLIQGQNNRAAPRQFNRPPPPRARVAPPPRPQNFNRGAQGGARQGGWGQRRR